MMNEMKNDERITYTEQVLVCCRMLKPPSRTHEELEAKVETINRNWWKNSNEGIF